MNCSGLRKNFLFVFSHNLNFLSGTFPLRGKNLSWIGTYFVVSRSLKFIEKSLNMFRNFNGVHITFRGLSVHKGFGNFCRRISSLKSP